MEHHLSHAVNPRELIGTVLVVDQSDNATLISESLAKHGWNPVIASNAGEARACEQRYKPEFVVTELILPRETGFEYCRYLKEHNHLRPVLILTEVDLDSARNLAIWAGADGYLTKPISGEVLCSTIEEIAVAAWQNVQKAKEHTDGKVTFKCGCGRQLAVSADNAGRATMCKRCGKLVKAPKISASTEGVWRAGEADKKSPFSQQDQTAGFFCHRCGSAIQLLSHRRHDRVSCRECKADFDVPEWVRSRQRFFFSKHRTSENSGDSLIQFAPLGMVDVRCEDCHTYFRFFPNGHHKDRLCPKCGSTQQTPSLRGASLSRAALISTGRLFLVMAGKHKGKKILLPRSKPVVFGGGEHCDVRFRNLGLSEQHFRLRTTDNGPMLEKLTTDCGLTINDGEWTQPLTLEAGDIIRAGELSLRLLGNREHDENKLMLSILKQDTQRGDSSVTGHSDLSLQAAQIIQLHWEKQREAIRASGVSLLSIPIPEKPEPRHFERDDAEQTVERDQSVFEAKPETPMSVTPASNSVPPPLESVPNGVAAESPRSHRQGLPAVRLPDPETVGLHEEPEEDPLPPHRRKKLNEQSTIMAAERLLKKRRRSND